MKYSLRQTKIFRDKYKKIIPFNKRIEVKKKINKLASNPYNSKPLGYKFFREKKIDKWRIYFIIYNEKLILYFVDLSDKKLQQKTIEKIKKEFI